jgi:hypothetical protein
MAVFCVECMSGSDARREPCGDAQILFLKSGRKRTQWWRERDETLTDIARSYNIKAYGVKEDAGLPENSGTVFVR